MGTSECEGGTGVAGDDGVGGGGGDGGGGNVVGGGVGGGIGGGGGGSVASVAVSSSSGGGGHGGACSVDVEQLFAQAVVSWPMDSVRVWAREVLRLCPADVEVLATRRGRWFTAAHANQVAGQLVGLSEAGLSVLVHVLTHKDWRLEQWAPSLP